MVPNCNQPSLLGCNVCHGSEGIGQWSPKPRIFGNVCWVRRAGPRLFGNKCGHTICICHYSSGVSAAIHGAPTLVFLPGEWKTTGTPKNQKSKRGAKSGEAKKGKHFAHSLVLFRHGGQQKEPAADSGPTPPVKCGNVGTALPQTETPTELTKSPQTWGTGRQLKT